MKLCELEVGEKCIVHSVHATSEMSARLQDIGFVEGAIIQCVLCAPRGEPKAYSILGTVIALRQNDARGIIVEPC